MKVKKLLSVLAVGLALLSVNANAHLVYMGEYQPNLPNANPDTELDWLKTLPGVPSDVEFLFKDDGTINNPKNLDITVTGLDALTGTVSWDVSLSGWSIDYVLVKSGSGRDVGGYNVYSVSADQRFVNLLGDEIVGPYNKEISHVSIFGRPGGTVPDGGLTAVLLGLALSGMGATRRFLKK